MVKLFPAGTCERFVDLVCTGATLDAAANVVGASDVRGGVDGPIFERRGARGEVDGRIDQRRNDHAAEGRRDQDNGPAWRFQVSGNEFAFEIQAGDEEEDRQQAVRCQLSDAQFQMQGLEADFEVPDGQVTVSRRRVGPDQGGNCGDEQQDPADGLLAHQLAEPHNFGGDFRG